MAENTLINEFFDLSAFAEQAQEVVNQSEKTAKAMKDTFERVAPNLNVGQIQAYSEAVSKIERSHSDAKKAASDYEKAMDRLGKATAQSGEATEKLDEVLASEVHTIAEMQAKSKALEAIRKHLSDTDAKYAENQRKIIEAQNRLNESIKQYQTEESKRVSGIGKYEEAIRRALSGQGNYRTQIASLKNTMADLEQEIKRVTEAEGADSDAAKLLKEQYERLQDQAGKLSDAQGDMNARVKFLADDYGKLKGAIMGVQAAAGIFSMFKGAASIFGKNSEAVEKIAGKLTQLIAVLGALMAIKEKLNKDSYFRQFIKNSPAIQVAASKIGTAFKKMGLSIQAAAGIFGVIAAAMVAFFAAFKNSNISLLDRFKKKTDDTTGSLNKQKSAVENLNSGFKSYEVRLTGLTEKLREAKKAQKELIKEIASAAIATALQSEIDSYASKLVEFEKFKQGKLKEIKEQEDKKAAAREEDASNINAAQTFASPENAASAIASNAIAGDAKRKIRAANKKIKELQDEIDKKKEELDEAGDNVAYLMNISAEEISVMLDKVIPDDWLKRIDELDKGSGNQNPTEVVNNVKEAVTEAVTEAAPEIDKAAEALAEFTELFDSDKLDRLREYNSEVESLRKQFMDGTITVDEYNERLAETDYDYQRKELVSLIGHLEDLAMLFPQAFDAKALEDAKRKLSDLDFKKVMEDYEKNNEKLKKSIVDVWTDTANIINSTLDSIQSLFNSVVDAQIDRLKKQGETEAAYYDDRAEMIEATVEDEREKAAALEALKEEEKESEIRRNREIAEMERRKAKLDAGIAINRALADTALAMAEAVLSASAGDPYTVAFRVAAALTSVVAAAATIAGAIGKITAIPEYAKGGVVEKGQIFRAGEEGFEIAEGRSGRRYVMQKDALYIAPEKMAIRTHRQSEAMAANTTNNYNKDVRLHSSISVKVIDSERVNRYFRIK